MLFEQIPAHVWTTDTDLRVTSAAGRGWQFSASPKTSCLDVICSR